MSLRGFVESVQIVLQFFSQPSIYIDGWLYAMSMTSVVCNVPVLSQNDSPIFVTNCDLEKIDV